MKINLNKQLQKAISVAVDAHAEQFDKGGKPYILHPLHLMNELSHDTQLATIAVLHDVVEDSEYTLDNLSDMGFSQRVVGTLSLLTHSRNQPYEEYIENICGNMDAITVKMEDLKHNSDITRLKGVTEKDTKRMVKYHNAYLRLIEAKRNYLQF